MIPETFRRVPPSKCVICDAPNDAATSPEDKGSGPRSGDVSVCLYCGHLSAFNIDLTLRPLTDGERSIVTKDERVTKLVKEIKVSNQRRLN